MVTSGKVTFDINAFKKSFEALDVDEIMTYYSPNFEHIEIGADAPPKSPRKSGAAEIRGAFEGIRKAGMKLHLENLVVGQGHAACTITVDFTDGRRLVSNTIYDLRDEKIIRQRDVYATDPLESSTGNNLSNEGENIPKYP